MSYIRLSASSEVLSKLVPLKGRVIEGRVVGKAGELPLLEIGDLLFPAESKVPLEVGAKVSLWIKGLVGDKLHLQLLSEEEIDEGFLRLNLKDAPENKLAYRILKGLGVSFSKEEVELLGEIILKGKDISFILESLKAIHRAFGLTGSFLKLLLWLGDTFSLRELLVKLLLYGDEDIKGLLRGVVPDGSKISADSIKSFLLKSGILESGELFELVLKKGGAEEARLLGWLLLPRLLSLRPEGGDWFIYLWFPVLWGKNDIAISSLKKHKGKGEEKDGERYELIIELKSLGKIRVLFYILEGKLWVTFEAEDERTLALIKGNLSSLLSSLEGQGYKIGGLSSRSMAIERSLEGEGLDIRI